MSYQNDHIDINRLRSYSAIFSSPSFTKLLVNDDFSFLNSRIATYDADKIGASFSTYYEYIKYIYNQLENSYRNEYYYKNKIINDILIKKYGLKHTMIINEFRVGNSIADIVMFNGTSKAFEIKTELDTNKRLNNQLIDYSRIFQECYIITHESLIEKYENVNENIGLIKLSKKKNYTSLIEVRPPKLNLFIDSDTLICAIRTNEYKNIVLKYFGYLPKMNSFNMFEICREMLKQIPSVELHKLFISELKRRKSNTPILNQFPSELRQVFFTLRLKQPDLFLLHNKLNRKINT